MLKTIVSVGLALGAVALHAPAASGGWTAPDHVGCVSGGVAVPGGHTVLLAGWAIDEDASHSVSIRCEIRNGAAVVASSPPGPANYASNGKSAAGTADVVTYSAATHVCTMWKHYNGTVNTVGEFCVTGVPLPREVTDLLYVLLDTGTQIQKDYVDPLLCPVLELLNGSYGPVQIKPGNPDFDPTNDPNGGDVWVAGRLVYNCPGY